MLPEGVEWLQLVFASQLPLSLHRLPHTLQQLQLSTRHPLCFLQGSFAAHVQLRQLTLSGKGWAGPLSPHWLPPALVELNPQWTLFDSPLVRHALPATLRKIVLSHHYEQAFTSDSFAFRCLQSAAHRRCVAVDAAAECRPPLSRLPSCAW